MVVWSPLRFNCGREMANRFAIAPLTTDSSHEDGTAPDNELEFVRRRAASGFGAAISSAAYVEQDGRSWQGIGAAHDGHLPSLNRLAEAMRAAGGLAILQIYDGGRIAKPELIGEQCLRAPSAVASLRPGAKTPRAMTSDEIESLIASFREAASLAKGRFRRRRGSWSQPLRGSSVLFTPGQSSRRQVGRHAFETHELPARRRAGRSRRAWSKADRRVSRYAVRGRVGWLYA